MCKTLVSAPLNMISSYIFMTCTSSSLNAPIQKDVGKGEVNWVMIYEMMSKNCSKKLNWILGFDIPFPYFLSWFLIIIYTTNKNFIKNWMLD